MQSLLMVALAATGLSAPVLGQAPGEQFTVAGVNSDGSTYDGRAVITMGGNGGCELIWTIDDDVTSGVCLRSATSLSVGYGFHGQVGVAVYDILVDGSMEGRWWVGDGRSRGTETLTPVH